MKTVKIYDTTLRDGTQAEDVNFSVEDKIRVAQKLDELGVHYIEGGWPASNPTDERFFKEIHHYALKNAKITAFGSTHAVSKNADNDPNLKSLIASGVDVITIFGKTWDIHVKEALKTTLEKNLELIKNSLLFLRPKVKELFFDAEHFFDGFKENKEYTLACLKKALEGKADVLVLCDTNGGTTPSEIRQIIREVKKELPHANLGIHAHNDSELAVANSIIAVEEGAIQVQGTINGYGERCGNANLCSIIPNLQLKLGYACLPEDNLRLLTSTSLFVSEVANLPSFHRQPFVGKSAFAHKGGVHVSAVRKNPRTYEHIKPELVGNKQRILLSDLAGQSNILFKARQYGFHLDKNDPFVLELLAKLKELESQGYEYTAAEASFELLLNRVLGRARTYFTLENYRVLETKRKKEEPISEATVMVRVGGMLEHTAATGKGPVNALDNALRKALEKFYPCLKEMHLIDFKVRVFSSLNRDLAGTASKVRVLIESGDPKHRWITVGVSFNIIEASRQALEDSLNYKLFKSDQEKLTKALKEASEGF
ncbi:(R)-citramalate synthase [Desulfonauticus submarinus]|uniref:Citramalate synthase n=1 Tax=Desulfonauticus submarinus TaxID=206665 RepID=A0A1H0CFY8_9BACT|nr:citramalate synthase [Desulfonauticus submarinus]SDN56762.1 (R)-citramalate synthase [Desulfonauticus submarinus]